MLPIPWARCGSSWFMLFLLSWLSLFSLLQLEDPIFRLSSKLNILVKSLLSPPAPQLLVLETYDSVTRDCIFVSFPISSGEWDTSLRFLPSSYHSVQISVIFVWVIVHNHKRSECRKMNRIAPLWPTIKQIILILEDIFRYWNAIL